MFEVGELGAGSEQAVAAEVDHERRDAVVGAIGLHEVVDAPAAGRGALPDGKGAQRTAVVESVAGYAIGGAVDEKALQGGSLTPSLVGPR